MYYLRGTSSEYNFYRSNQIFYVIKENVIEKYCFKQSYFSVNKHKKFIFNKMMFYSQLYCFYDLHVSQTNTKCKEMFLSV